MKKTIIILFSALCLLAGCKHNDKNVVKIGVVGPLTGAGATTSAYWTNGLNYAIEHLNAIEGGEKYELLVEDCQSDPAQAVACYKRLELLGVKYVLAVGGQFSMAVAPLTNGKDVLYFTTADYNEAILDQTDHGFRIFPSSVIFADTAVNYLCSNYGVEKYATFALNTVACLEATKAFAKGVERVEGELVFQETYDMGAADFNSVVAKVADKGAEGIFMTGFGISPLAFANQIAANSSFDSIILFGDLNLATKSFVEGIRNSKATICYADCRFPDSLETAYMDKYGSHSNAIVTSSYIIPFMIQNARANADKKSIEEQLKYMRGRTLETKVGNVTLDEKGNCEMGVQVFQLQ